jgi:hypothetical protein
MVGMFVWLCLAIQKPSELEFFVAAITDLGDKLLTKTPGSSLVAAIGTVTVVAPDGAHVCWGRVILVGGKGKQVERVRIKVIGDFWRMRNIVSHLYLPFRI